MVSLNVSSSSSISLDGIVSFSNVVDKNAPRPIDMTSESGGKSRVLMVELTKDPSERLVTRYSCDLKIIDRGIVNCEITLEFLNNGWTMDVFDRLGLEKVFGFKCSPCS